jgi:hypothetical protein
MRNSTADVHEFRNCPRRHDARLIDRRRFPRRQRPGISPTLEGMPGRAILAKARGDLPKE